MRACASVSARGRFEPHAGLHRENAALASGGLNFSLVSIIFFGYYMWACRHCQGCSYVWTYVVRV